MSSTERTSSREPIALMIMMAAIWVFSSFVTHDLATWLLEAIWVPIGIAILWATYRRFPLTPLLYRLLSFHAVILIVGAIYTYAKVPAGDWVKNVLSLERNPYDRLGHLTQGFVPAMLVRELLLRTSPLRRGKWLYVLVVCAALAFSAFYELMEWWGAALLRQGADAFLGTQGDQWDTQWDMFCALLGANFALLILGRLHDRQIARLTA